MNGIVKPKPRLKLKLWQVFIPQGYEGTYNLMSLILGYADRYGWKPGEIQRVAELEIGGSLFIEEHEIKRIR